MRRKIGVLTASISRNAGGLHHSVRRLTEYVHAAPEPWQTLVLATADEFSREDSSAWSTIPVATSDLKGPKSFGYSPGWEQRLEDWHPDLLHVHGIWMYPSVAALTWHRRTRRPYVISTHGMLDPWAVRNSGWKKQLVSLLYERKHLENATCLRALNLQEAAAMRSFGLKNPVCVIPNGVDAPEEGSPAEVEATAGARHGSGDRTCLFLGRLHAKKGLPGLLRMWGRERPAGWRLVVAGWDQNGHEAELRRLSESLGIADRVSFAGPTFGAAKAAAFRNADAFVLPSFSEGLPVAVLEAWSYGVPVAMTDECNLTEGFETGAAVRITTEGEGLKQLLEMSDESRSQMGARGRVLVEQRFTWQRVAREMVGVYEWILGRAPRPACVMDA
ncbi:glycosyltransferase [Paludibaculum fermentans]|uniref:Glycosyltransferase n=1 Tax=Paludibaculum fermentans TaxID=1473598 RepID=A0A7S7NL55_PALFE|nr:glycosyltransferase [Paludibaculum fermentans]QOY85094.1 glycosyltransferase [Paludibaculum fermentans]